MKKKIMKTALLTSALCLASAGGVSAYLTDYEKTSNQFTVGKVDLELEEPDWKPEENTKIEPGKNIDKNPQIKNTGVTDAYVYMEVTIPRDTVMAAAEDGSRLEKENQELFSFTPDENWTILGSIQKENVQIYTYSYNEVLKPEAVTTPLFSKLKFLNVIEGQLDLKTLEVPVRAYAIQASYTGGEEGTVVERAKIAFEKYVNQNKGQDGETAGELI